MIKEEIRKEFIRKRNLLSPGELDNNSNNIAHLLFSNYQLEGKKVSLFLPIESKKEVNTYGIWEKARTFGAEVAVPKINTGSSELKHIVFESHEQLEISSFGIPEPKKGRVMAAEHFDYVFVPLLYCDTSGNRIGYGGGYYDRFLAKCAPRCVFVGLSHFDPGEELIDNLHDNDIKLHALISPNKLHRFG